jgi:TRAP-type C4-dicarboxylate transport system substrate-binding protein
VTSVGLSMVDESIRVLELPRMFASVEELDYVADKMWPYFVKKFEAKGFRSAIAARSAGSTSCRRTR